MLVADLEGDLEENAEAMIEVLDEVKCGEVTTAIKDSKTSDGREIHPDDIIGIADGSLDVVGKSVEEVTLALIDELDDDLDSLTLLAGEDFAQEDFEKLDPDLEVDAQRGEQPLYPIVFSIE